MNYSIKKIIYSFAILALLFGGYNVSAQEENNCTLGEGDVYFQAFRGTITNKIVTLVIDTSDTCSGEKLKVYLHSIDNGSRVEIDLFGRGANDYVEIEVVEGEKTYIYYKAKDDECFSSNTPNCRIFTEIKNSNDEKIFSSEGALRNIINEINKKDTTTEKNTVINDSNYKNGILLKDCSGWTFLSCGITSETTDWEVLEKESETTQVLLKRQIDQESPCLTNEESYDPNCYELLAKIPDPSGESIFEVDSNTGRQFVNTKDLQVGSYINQIFRIALAILFVIAIIMIIIAGVQYMTVESFYGKSNAKERITNAVVGLLVALGISIILGTINPRLLEVNFTTGLKPVTISFENRSTYSDDQIVESVKIQQVDYTKALKKELSSNNKNYKLAYEVADELKIPNCIAKVILDRESKGGSNAIGHDENVTAVSGVWSREAFIASGIKYSGANFTPNSSLLTDKSFKNDDSTIDTSKDDLGLDWRFSHGIGLTQTTVFPKNYNWKSNEYIAWISQNQQAAWDHRDEYKTFINSIGNTYTPKQLLDPKTNLKAGFEHWKGYYKKCGDVQGAFNSYATGSCTRDTSWKEAEERTRLYNICVSS